MNKNKLLANNLYLFMILTTLPHLIVSMDRDRNQSFYAAVLENDIPKAKELLKNYNIDVNKVAEFSDETPLCAAVSRYNIDMVKFLLTQPSIDLNVKCGGKYGKYTVMHYALLEYRCAVRKQNLSRSTVLYHIITDLLDSGANPYDTMHQLYGIDVVNERLELKNLFECYKKLQK